MSEYLSHGCWVICLRGSTGNTHTHKHGETHKWTKPKINQKSCLDYLRVLRDFSWDSTYYFSHIFLNLKNVTHVTCSFFGQMEKSPQTLEIDKEVKSFIDCSDRNVLSTLLTIDSANVSFLWMMPHSEVGMLFPKREMFNSFSLEKIINTSTR